MPELVKPTSARHDCPFAAVAIPGPADALGRVSIQLARPECGPRCALYDGGPCLPRLLDAVKLIGRV